MILILLLGVCIGFTINLVPCALNYHNGYEDAKRHYLIMWTKSLESANHDVFEGWKAEVKTSVVEGRYPRETMIQLVIFSQDRRQD